METIQLVGYHGTTNYFADKIFKENKFKLSEKNNEWLGYGIYFWVKKEDGFEWAQMQLNRHSKNDSSHTKPCVIKCNLSCQSDEYIDLSKNMDKLENFTKQYEYEMSKNGSKRPNFRNKDEMRSFYCGLFKKKYNIKIMKFSFRYIPYNCVGFPQYGKCIEKAQICVTDNNCITNKECVR